jgi:uncharacterized protein
MNRRDWLYLAASGVSAVALSKVLGRVPVRRTRGLGRAGLRRSNNGPLALPPDFYATVLSRTGTPMSDGVRTPALPDGMACFQGPGGEWILARNHEVGRDAKKGGYPKGQPALAHDPGADGGVSRLVLDATNLRVISSNMILTGTINNCSGGPSPWGYLTCEEAEDEGHGFVFLCDPAASELRAPVVITGYGRFRHEAVAVDPETARAYLTEDQGDGCLYRFTPNTPRNPFVGQLEVARSAAENHFATDKSMHPGDSIPVEWVPILDPFAKTEPLRAQAARGGALTVRRGEGIWFEPASAARGKSVVFTATTGGEAGKGQIFRLSLGSQFASATGGQNELDRLEVLAEAPPRHGLQFPDNITVAPWGDVVVAEDGFEPNHLVGVRADGSCYPIARNIKSGSEFAGVCFSPDGSTLFCNLQVDGLTLAIRGPWETLAQPSSA